MVVSLIQGLPLNFRLVVARKREGNEEMSPRDTRGIYLLFFALEKYIVCRKDGRDGMKIG